LTTAAQQRRAYVAWVVICLVWGTTYLAIKVALDTIPPFLMGGIRYLTAGALLAGFVVATGRRLPDRTGWRHALVCGALLLGIGNGGVVCAEKWVETGLAAVIVAATPFWMVSIEAAFGGERLTRRAAVGLALGFGGIVWLVWPTLQGSLADARGAGLGFVVGVASLQAASAGWAVGSSYSRRHATRGDAFGAAAAQMICGGLVMLVAGSLTGEWQVISLTPPTLAALVYLTVAGSLVGFVCYIYALHHLPTSFVSLYTYVNPIVAVTLGALVLGEKVGWRVPSAIATILAGMAIVSWRRSTPIPRAARATSSGHAPSDHASAADQAHQEQHDRDHEQEVDELTDRHSAHHPQQPQHDQDHRNRFEH
jgi:drug/metabolite transporter (DMT)-like permease